MSDTKGQRALDGQNVSRRDLLKLSSLAIGALAIPGVHAGALDDVRARPAPALDPQLHFQWQNEFLCKTIYPMREAKLRDFLIFYKEVDVWAQYRDKDINAFANEVKQYISEWEANAAAALGEYVRLRDYFLAPDARPAFSDLLSIHEDELSEINRLHVLFADDWPRDIRGERSYVEGILANWVLHRDAIRARIRSRTRRLEAMSYDHPKRPAETVELEVWETLTLPMAEQELNLLRAFLATYDRVEERKLAWYRLTRNDPDFKTPEADFLIKYPADRNLDVRDLAYWRIRKYTQSIATKNQFELLDEIYQRFQREPGRFPAWLQYMVVHFSGMRYASAHGSWADPKDLMIRMSVLGIESELKSLDDAEIERRCQEKASAYESPDAAGRPGLALATEAEWQDRLQRALVRVNASGPRTRRAGLLELLTEEAAYEIANLSAGDTLSRLAGMKGAFPDWAWKEVVRFTPLRVSEVSGPDWEKLTPQEEQERYSPRSNAIRRVMDAWENRDPTAWRAEHGRTLELIVTRAVCNEAAEHCQHVRGHLPPGGLAARPKWYNTNEIENELPGSYYIRPTSEEDCTRGASILWLRFVNSSASNPSQWNVARSIETQQGVGLLPAAFTAKAAKPGDWVYRLGQVITRLRTLILPDRRRVVEKQWLRWIHEATVAEVAETADGMTVITFETALPGDPDGSSTVGTFKLPLDWLLADGTEDDYHRAFVGYVPEKPVPAEHLERMLDWNRIFRRKVV